MGRNRVPLRQAVRKACGCPIGTYGASLLGGVASWTPQRPPGGDACPPCRLQLLILPVAQTGCPVPHFRTDFLGRFAAQNHHYLRVGWERTKPAQHDCQDVSVTRYGQDMVWCFTGKETEGFCQNGDVVLSVDTVCLVPSWSQDNVIDR